MTFNQKAWTLCARIPRGQVATYADLARALNTHAYRAVGNAMNKNPYAPKVPCHRVVGSDGSLTGYAGGLAKKRRMLAEEGIFSIVPAYLRLAAQGEKIRAFRADEYYWRDLGKPENIQQSEQDIKANIVK